MAQQATARRTEPARFRSTVESETSPRISRARFMIATSFYDPSLRPSSFSVRPGCYDSDTVFECGGHRVCAIPRGSSVCSSSRRCLQRATAEVRRRPFLRARRNRLHNRLRFLRQRNAACGRDLDPHSACASKKDPDSRRVARGCARISFRTQRCQVAIIPRIYKPRTVYQVQRPAQA